MDYLARQPVLCKELRQPGLGLPPGGRPDRAAGRHPGRQPPTNPELLEWLTKDFIELTFDVRHPMRTICRAAPPDVRSGRTTGTKDDTSEFWPTRSPTARSSRRVLFDAIHGREQLESRDDPGAPRQARPRRFPMRGSTRAMPSWRRPAGRCGRRRLGKMRAARPGCSLGRSRGLMREGDGRSTLFRRRGQRDRAAPTGQQADNGEVVDELFLPDPATGPPGPKRSAQLALSCSIELPMDIARRSRLEFEAYAEVDRPDCRR